MRLTTVFTILAVTAFAGIMLYLLSPLLLQSTYEGQVFFNLTGETSFEGRSYYTGGSTLGSFKLQAGGAILVEEKGNPCGSSYLQYNHALLIDQETGEVVDSAKFSIVNPSKLEAPHDGTFSVGIGVIKSVIYDQRKSIGTWKLEITVKKSF